MRKPQTLGESLNTQWEDLMTGARAPSNEKAEVLRDDITREDAGGEERSKAVER